MSKLDKTFQETVFNTLTSLLAQNKFDSDTQLDIYLAMKKAAMDLQESQIQKLQEKIEHWESMYGQADTSLYTLGLRHAVDILSGQTATDANGFNDKPYIEGQEFELDETVEDI
jgi:hypothetical protein